MGKTREKGAGVRRGTSLVLGLLLALALVATSGSVRAAEGGKDYKITILGGSAGGVWSVITEGVAESIRRGLPGAQITTEPGKDGPNQVMVAQGKVQFAVTYDSTNYAAVAGKTPYKSELPNLRTVAILNPTGAFQFFIDKKTGIKSFEEIAEKKYPLRVGANRKGTLMHLSGEAVLAAYGAPYDQIEKWGGKIHYVPSNQSMDLWDAGQLDATQEVAQFPISKFLEHATKHDLRLLPIDDPAKLEALSKELGMSPFTIPAHTYPFQDEDCRTLNTKLILLSSADVPDQLVYDVVKSMNESLDYLHKVHANLKDMTPEIMANGAMVALHPGAAKYYREIGAVK